MFYCFFRKKSEILSAVKKFKRFASLLAYHSVLLSIWCVGCTSMDFYEKKLETIPSVERPLRGRSLAVVLGGGGSRGAAHIGVLEVLEEHKIKIDLIVGCSAGALVGALYSAKPDAKYLKEILLNKKFEDLVEIDITKLPFALSGGVRLSEFLENHLNEPGFEALQIPFVAVATELGSGRRTAFGKGDVVSAVVASSAVPGFYPCEALWAPVCRLWCHGTGSCSGREGSWCKSNYRSRHR